MGGLGVAGPQKLAIVCGDERLTYGALTARVSQFAAGFDVPVRGEEARGEQRPWDYYKQLATIPAEEAWRPLDQGTDSLRPLRNAAA